MSPRSVTEKLTIDRSSVLYNTPHKGSSIVCPDLLDTSEHLKNYMVCVDIAFYGSGFIIFIPYGARLSSHVYSCLSYSENKLRVDCPFIGLSQSSRS